MARRLELQTCIDQNPDGTVTIRNLFHAGFFIMRGHQVVTLKATGEPNRYDFVFAPGESFGADALDFDNNGLVPVKDFLHGINLAKRRAFGPKKPLR